MQIVQGLLFHVGQNIEDPAARLLAVESPIGISDPILAPAAGRKETLGLFVVQASERKLFEIVGALQTPGRLTRRLHSRQQQRDQDADDRNDHEQFDQGKTV